MIVGFFRTLIVAVFKLAHFIGLMISPLPAPAPAPLPAPAPAPAPAPVAVSFNYDLVVGLYKPTYSAKVLFEFVSKEKTSPHLAALVGFLRSNGVKVLPHGFEWHREIEDVSVGPKYPQTTNRFIHGTKPICVFLGQKNINLSLDVETMRDVAYFPKARAEYNFKYGLNV